MTQLELIEAIEALPLQQLPPLREVIERRLLSSEVEIGDESDLTLIPTQEQQAELNRLRKANQQGQLEMMEGEEFLASLRRRLGL